MAMVAISPDLSLRLLRAQPAKAWRLGLVELVTQRDRIAHTDRSRARGPRVQGERSVELLRDPPENGDVLDAGLRVPRGHDAPAAKIREADHGLPDREVAALPAALGKARHASDHEVRPQPPVIGPERFDRAIGGYEQRQDVEASGALHGLKVCFGPRGGADPCRDVAVLPVPPAHLHAPAWTERRPMPQQSVPRARVLDATGSVDHDQLAITGDPERADVGPLELLAGHRLDR